MGITNNNPLLVGVRGKIGNLVIKQYSYGTVITSMPAYTKRKPSPLQKLHREMFAAAVKFAKEVKHNFLLSHTIAMRKESQALYHFAIKEYMTAGRLGQKNNEPMVLPKIGAEMAAKAAKAAKEMLGEKTIAKKAAKAKVKLKRKLSGKTK